MDLQTYATYNATEEELVSYGLNEPELSITVNYTYTDEKDDENQISDTCIIHISRNPEEVKAAEEAEANEEEDIPNVTKYVRIGDSQIVYELSDSSYKTLIDASYNDLRHNEVFWADTDIITQIDVTEEISLTIYLDNEKFPQIKIQLYRNDGDSCLAVVDGESISLVERSDVIDLVEAVQAIVLN